MNVPPAGDRPRQDGWSLRSLAQIVVKLVAHAARPKRSHYRGHAVTHASARRGAEPRNYDLLRRAGHSQDVLREVLFEATVSDQLRRRSQKSFRVFI